MCRPLEDNGDKPLKLKDPGSFMVNIIIRAKKTEWVILDLGAGINIMSYSVYLRLGLGKLKLTQMILQPADRSIKHPKGIVKDLLVQVDKFKVPMDFVVLEMKGAPMKHKEHMILLRRPVMATTKTVIDIQSEKLTMTVLRETIQLKAVDSLPYPFATSHNQCSYVDYIDLLVYNISFQGTAGSDLEVTYSKDRWKKR